VILTKFDLLFWSWLWPFDLKTWSVHICAQLHRSCKVREIPTSGL